MITRFNLLRSLWHAVTCVCEIIGYGLSFVWALICPRATLAARLLASESQLAVCLDHLPRRKNRRLQFSPGFRLLWVVLSKCLDSWEYCAQLMQPATVKKWHVRAFRQFWRWKSRQRGRPPISKEMRALIRRMSKENPLWSPERIRDTLLLLGFERLCEDTVRKYMVTPRKPRKRSTTWLPFLRNHLSCSWAIDFFTVTTLTFNRLYVFVVLDHAQRQVLHYRITYHPSMKWVIQQLRETMPFGQQPRYLFRDNDRIYGHGVRAFLDSCGIEEVRSAYRSPWQNPYLERIVGTLRRELLDHVDCAESSASRPAFARVH